LELERKKANDDLIKLRTDHAAEKTRALDELRNQLRTEFMTERTNLINSSRITLDFYSQSTHAKEVVQKLISAGAVQVDSLDKGISLKNCLIKVGPPSASSWQNNSQSNIQSTYSVRGLQQTQTQQHTTAVRR
jgi:hypothetical protein